MSFLSRQIIEKGWSNDRKYRVQNQNGDFCLLRISSMEKYENRKALFEYLKKLSLTSLSMPAPLDFGTCEEGVYLLSSWIEGEDAEAAIPLLEKEEQYRLGLQAGRMLKTIHSLPAPASQPEWETRFNAKIDRKIENYQKCSIHFDGAEYFLDYLNQNRGLLKNRPQTFQHGDYHVGNMLLSEGKIVVIDFDRYDFGDPWEEFNRIVWCAQAAPVFACGMVDGYFEGDVPHLFWQLLALYISSNMLSSIPWAIPFGEEEVQTMLRQAQEILSWYDHMKTPIPAWYQSANKDFILR